MNKCLFVVLTLGLLNVASAGDQAAGYYPEIDSPLQFVPRVLQDPKTKVIFYLESNRHHLSAISPEGKLLWQEDTWSHNWWERFFQSFTNSNSTELNHGAALINGLDLCHSDDFVTVHHENPEDFLSVHLNVGVVGLFQRSTGKFIFELKN